MAGKVAEAAGAARVEAPARAVPKRPAPVQARAPAELELASEPVESALALAGLALA